MAEHTILAPARRSGPASRRHGCCSPSAAMTTDAKSLIADLVTGELTRGPRGVLSLSPEGAGRVREALASIPDATRFQEALFELVRFACWLERSHGAAGAARALLAVGEQVSVRLITFGVEPEGLRPDPRLAAAGFRRFQGSRPARPATLSATPTLAARELVQNRRLRA